MTHAESGVHIDAATRAPTVFDSWGATRRRLLDLAREARVPADAVDTVRIGRQRPDPRAPVQVERQRQRVHGYRDRLLSGARSSQLPAAAEASHHCNCASRAANRFLGPWPRDSRRRHSR